MEKWEIATEKFIAEWKKKKEVVGILACGSYVTGNPSAHSDIDIPIILSDKVDWRERGNKIVDGFLIEYFANPLKQIRKEFEENYNDNRQVTAHLLATGKVLYDKDGTVKKLRKEAKAWLNKKLKRSGRIEIEFAKYCIWDECDNLQSIYKRKSPSFEFTYYGFLGRILHNYSKFVGHAMSSRYNTFEFLTDRKTQKKYLSKEFPDRRFVKLFATAMGEHNRDQMMKNAEELKNYVLDKMGGFNVDEWKVRTKLDKN